MIFFCKHWVIARYISSVRKVHARTTCDGCSVCAGIKNKPRGSNVTAVEQAKASAMS